MTPEQREASRAYITALGNLRLAASREQDRAQEGAQPSVDFAKAWTATEAARLRYRRSL